MAQLKIDLVVDDHGAVSTLNNVEAATKRVEAASTSSAAAVTNTSPGVVSAHSAQADAALKSASAHDKLGLSFKQMVGATIAFASSEVVLEIAHEFLELGRQAFEAASHLVDMSAKTGLSIETLQRLAFVGTQTGVSMDAFSNASFMLGVNLNKGGATAKKVAGDLEELGLSLAQVKTMTPDQQIMKTLEALGHMDNATERNRIGVELMGKAYKAVSSSVGEDFGAMADAANVASDEQVRALKHAEDAWNRFVKNAETRAVQFLGSTVLMGEGAMKIMEGLGKGDFSSLKGFLALSASGKDPITALLQLSQTNKPHKDINLPTAPTEDAGDDKDAAKKLKDAERAAKQWQESLDKLSGTEAIKTANDWMKKVAEIGGVTRLAAKDQKSYNEALSEAIDAMHRAGKSVDPKMMQAFLNSFQGPAIHGGVPVTGIDKFGNPEGMPGTNIGKPQVPFVPLPNIGITSGLGNFGGQLPGQQFDLGQIQAAAQQAAKSSDLFHVLFGSSADFGAKLSSTVMQALTGGGNLGKSVGGLLGTDLLGGLAKELTAKGGIMIGGALGGILKSVLPGLGGILGSLGGALLDKLFGSKGRDAVKDFAAAEGGFDQLHASLNKLGAEGEKLWVNLTQGVGKNNPKEAAAAIDAIKGALAHAPASAQDDASMAGFETIADLQMKATQAQKVYEYVKNSGLYSAEAVQKAWEAANTALIASGDKQAIAAQAANTALTELNGKIQGLQASIANEAPEEVMGVIEQQTRAQIAALEQQRSAAQANIDAVKADLQPLVDGGITIPIHFKADALPVGPENNAPGGITNQTGGTILDENGNPVGTAGGGDNPDQYHSGGPIWRRMHRGGLASDEVPIIGQTGEFMMSRRGVAAVGLNNLRKMNNGQVTGSGHSDSQGMSTIIIEQDGRQAARFIVPHIPGEIRRLGLV